MVVALSYRVWQGLSGRVQAVAWPQWVWHSCSRSGIASLLWHGLDACVMASLGVAWPHVDDIASGVLHGLGTVSVGVSISQRMWHVLSGCGMFLV